MQRVVERAGLPRDVGAQMDVGAHRFAPAQVRLRGRNVLALVVAPESPLGDWFAALDQLLGDAPAMLADRPVVADLRAVLAEGGSDAVGIVLDGLEARDLRLVAAEGVERKALPVRWRRLAVRAPGREVALDSARGIIEAEPAVPVAPEPAEPEASALLIDRQVRSGESIVFPGGDVTIIGSVSSGAEVLAGGSIHVYGALRGRAVAGLKMGASARIFCRKLEAELVGVDRLYRTAEHWGAELQGRAVQVFCDRGSLRLSALD